MTTTETVIRIHEFRGNGLPVVSLYARVPTEPQGRAALIRSQVDSQLHQIRPMAEDHALGRDVMMSIRGDIDRITQATEEQSWSPGTVALFSCSGRGFFEEVQLPRSVRDRVMVDETPWVRPMLAVLDEYHRCRVVVVDRETARIWELYQNEMRQTDTVSLSAHPGKNDNKLEELTKKHFRQVVTMLDQLYRNDGFELLIVGGHPPELPRFLDVLTHELRPRVAGTFAVDDDAKTTFAEIKQQASAILERYERAEEERMVAEVMETSAAGGLAALGISPCLWAGSVAALGCLLIQDGAVAPGVVCDRDRWLALAGETCPLCDRPVRATPDVLDELVQLVIDDGGSTEHVSADTPLKEYVVAARLRFPLPPEPGQSQSS
jgi:peptide subunit release factor 1 (eRF1)